MQYFCCDEPRRAAVRAHPTLNGIDYLEVGDPTLPMPPERQLTLYIYLLKPLGSLTVTVDNVRIEGGERIRAAAPSVDVVSAHPPSNSEQTLLERLFHPQVTLAGVAQPVIPQTLSPLNALYVTSVTTSATSRVIKVGINAWGDFSTYILRLVNTKSADPLTGLDPLLSAVAFSFKVDCPSDFDCAPVNFCPPETFEEPEIDYLAKDYTTFRRLILDRMATIAPAWQERNPADLGVTLVELLAYVGDHLSYRQDAVATEAYLGTARRRISLRRHARLVDYFMHDGCNARVWIQVVVNSNTTIPAHTQLFTLVNDQPPRIAPASPSYDKALAANPTVFETMESKALYIEHNQISFYTWGAKQCCLPAGATRATLAGAYPNLHAGDVLIFQEVKSLQTGNSADADPTRRHAVRLISVSVTSDPLGGEFHDPATSGSVPITEIAWDAEDSLPFTFCLNGYIDEAHLLSVSDASVARGNIILADHGYSVPSESLGEVPTPVTVPQRVNAGGGPCAPSQPVTITPPFRPALQQAPLTQTAVYVTLDPGTGLRRVAPYDASASASAAFRWRMRDVLPAISLDGNGQTWTPRYDLLDSDPSAPDFVAEVDDTGQAILRFGDGVYGMRPAAGATATFTAAYRVGNGLAGNIGALTIRHIVNGDSAVVGAWNPMPARGGVEPEPIEHVRQSAPAAFLTQERAVTTADYTTMAKRLPEILNTRATFRWTGSWRTVFLTTERFDGRPLDRLFTEQTMLGMERYRMAGHDLDVDGPLYVPLEMEMQVCVKPDYFRSDVEQALLAIFTSGLTPDGRRGVFNPDNFTFGQTLHLSPVYAAAQAVSGVSSVKITMFRRRDTPVAQAAHVLLDGKIVFNRLEIPRLDNDPNYPERGVFRLVMEGGK
jgi:hypothetical protein